MSESIQVFSVLLILVVGFWLLNSSGSSVTPDEYNDQPFRGTVPNIPREHHYGPHGVQRVWVPYCRSRMNKFGVFIPGQFVAWENVPRWDFDERLDENMIMADIEVLRAVLDQLDNSDPYHIQVVIENPDAVVPNIVGWKIVKN